MFTWLNKQGVKNSEGFEVQFTGRFTAEYREGPLVVVVEIESGGNQFISFSRKAFERWSNSSSPISPPAQERMLKNFMAALEFQGLVGDRKSTRLNSSH